VEVEPEPLRRFGYDPSLLPAMGSGESAGETDYPLLLCTGANLLPYLHWQSRTLPRLRRLAPEPRVEIHPATARQYGLADGDLAEVETPVGRIRLKAGFTAGTSISISRRRWSLCAMPPTRWPAMSSMILLRFQPIWPLPNT
jgi:thiosulfate reductase / polysulfide reductase chain A